MKKAIKHRTALAAAALAAHCLFVLSASATSVHPRTVAEAATVRTCQPWSAPVAVRGFAIFVVTFGRCLRIQYGAVPSPSRRQAQTGAEKTI